MPKSRLVKCALVLLLTLPWMPVSARQFSVLYFNTWSGLVNGGVFVARSPEAPGAREFRLQLLSDGLRKMGPDYAGLSDLNPLPAVLDRLKQTNGLHGPFFGEKGGFRIGPVGLPVNMYSGSALLAGDPEALELVGTARLSGGLAGNTVFAGSANKVMIARTIRDGRELYLVHTNWTQGLWADEPNFRELVARNSRGEIEDRVLLAVMHRAMETRARRLEEARRTIDFINREVGQAPVILMGTLGCAPDSEEYRLLLDAGFRDSWVRGDGATWDEIHNANIALQQADLYRIGPSRDRVDYILYRGSGLRLVSSALVFNEPVYSTWPSDRFGILAGFELDHSR